MSAVERTAVDVRVASDTLSAVTNKTVLNQALTVSRRRVEGLRAFFELRSAVWETDMLLCTLKTTITYVRSV